jgi:WD40 repeat protein
MRQFPVALCLLAFSASALAAPVPKPPADGTRDREGNPLPRGAVARIGSLAFGSADEEAFFSSDGKRLLSLSRDGRVLAWAVDTGRLLPPARLTVAGADTFWFVGTGGGRVAALVLGSEPDGYNEVAVAKVLAFDLESGRIISRCAFEGDVPATHEMSVTPDGKFLIVASSTALERYDLDTGKRQYTRPLQRGRTLIGTDVTAPGARTHYVSADAKTLYYFTGGKLRRCAVATGEELPPVVDSALRPIQLDSPDGKRLVARSFGPIKNDQGRIDGWAPLDFLDVWDVVANKGAGRIEPGGQPVWFGAAGPDALLVRTWCARGERPTASALGRWNLNTLQRDWEVPTRTSADRGVVSPDGKWFALHTGTSGMWVGDAATGRPVTISTGHTGPVAWVGFTRDGTRVFTAAQDGVRTWTLGGELTAAAAPPEFDRGWVRPGEVGEHLVWVCYSENGKTAELVGWDRERGTIGWRAPAAVADTRSRVLSHDGKRAVRVEVDWANRRLSGIVYDCPAGKRLHSFTLGGELWAPMTLSPDGSILYFAERGGVVGLDPASGKETVRIATEQDRNERLGFPLAVSPDGTRIALLSQHQKQTDLRVIEVKSGRVVARHRDLKIYYSPSVRFSPGGTRLAVWGEDATTVRVFDAESSSTPPRELDAGKLHPTTVAFSPNGATLAVGYKDGSTLLWNVLAR